MDGPRNIFIEEFGEKKQKPSPPQNGKQKTQKAEAATVEPSGNIFIDEFGVKKKEETRVPLGSSGSQATLPEKQTLGAAGSKADESTSISVSKSPSTEKPKVEVVTHDEDFDFLPDRTTKDSHKFLTEIAKRQDAEAQLFASPKQAFGQPSDAMSQQMRTPKANAVFAGNPDAITDVINYEKQKIDRDIADIKGAAYSLTTGVLSQRDNERLETLRSDRQGLLRDGIKTLQDIYATRWQTLPNKTDEVKAALGSDLRKKLAAIDPVIYNDLGQPQDASAGYTDQQGKIGEKGKVKVDEILNSPAYKTFPVAKPFFDKRVQTYKTIQQENDYHNRAAINQSLANKDAETLDELLKTEGVKNEDMNTPEANEASTIFQRLKLYEADNIKLLNRYPQVKKAYEQNLVSEKFAEVVRDAREGKYGLAEKLTSERNLLTGNRLNQEWEIKAVAEKTGLSEDKVRQYADKAKVPSFLGLSVRSVDKTISDLQQGVNRLTMAKDDADVTNREIFEGQYHAPAAFQLRVGGKDPNVNFDAIVGTIFEVAPQALTFGVESYALKGLLNATGKIASGTVRGLMKGTDLRAFQAAERLLPADKFARLMVRSGVAESEAAAMGKLTNAVNRAKSIASVYTPGYLTSYEGAYQQAAQFSNDEKKRKEYAGQIANANAVSELIFNDADFAEKILKRVPTQQVFRKYITDAVPFGTKDIFMAKMARFAQIIGYESAEELWPVIKEAMAKEEVFDYQTSSAEFFNQALNTVITTAIGTMPMGVLGASRLPTSDLVKQSIYEAGRQSEKFKAYFDQQVDEGKISNEERNKANRAVNTIAKITDNLPEVNAAGRPLTQAEKNDIVYREVQNGALRKLEKEAPVGLQKNYTEEIKENQKVIDEAMTTEVSKEEEKENVAREKSSTNTKIFSILEDEYQGTLRQMQSENSSDERAKILSGLPQRIYERMEEDASVRGDSEAKRQLQELRRSISEEGAFTEEALRNMSESELADAPRRLLETIRSGLALPSVSSETTQGAGTTTTRSDTKDTPAAKGSSATTGTKEGENQKIKTAIEKAKEQGVLKGLNLMTAEAALQSEENADLFLKEISDQALNKIAPDVAKAEEAMDRAKSTYGEDLVKVAIEKYPVESKISPQEEKKGAHEERGFDETKGDIDVTDEGEKLPPQSEVPPPSGSAKLNEYQKSELAEMEQGNTDGSFNKDIELIKENPEAFLDKDIKFWEDLLKDEGENEFRVNKLKELKAIKESIKNQVVEPKPKESTSSGSVGGGDVVKKVEEHNAEIERQKQKVINEHNVEVERLGNEEKTLSKQTRESVINSLITLTKSQGLKEKGKSEFGSIQQRRDLAQGMFNNPEKWFSSENAQEGKNLADLLLRDNIAEEKGTKSPFGGPTKIDNSQKIKELEKKRDENLADLENQKKVYKPSSLQQDPSIKEVASKGKVGEVEDIYFMTGEELRELQQETKAEQKQKLIDSVGRDWYDKYSLATNKEKSKMEDALTDEQKKVFGGVGLADNQNPEAIKDLRKKIIAIETTEDKEVLGSRVRQAVTDLANDRNNKEAVAILNAAGKRAEELGFDKKQIQDAAISDLRERVGDEAAADILNKYFNKNEKATNISNTEKKEGTTNEKPDSDSEGAGKEPPKEPPKTEPNEGTGDGRLEKRFKDWAVIDKDKTITQDVKGTHEVREGAELLDENYQRLQRDKAATDLSMDLLIQDAKAELGDNYLDFLLNLVDTGNLELETRNAIMQSLLWRQGLSPDIINNLKAIDKKLATKSQDNFMIRRSLATEDEISDEQNDMIESALGDEGAEVKKAKEVLNESFSDNTVDEKVQMNAEGKTIEQLNEEIADLQKQLQEARKDPKLGKVDIKKFKAKAEMAANNLRNKSGNSFFSKIIDEINEIAKKC